MNVPVDGRALVWPDECQALSVPNFDSGIFRFRMDVQHAATWPQPAVNSVQDVHDVPGGNSSYGPRKQHHIEAASGQIHCGNIRITEIDPIAQPGAHGCLRAPDASLVWLQTNDRSGAFCVTPGKAPVARAYFEHVAPPQAAETVEDADFVPFRIKGIDHGAGVLGYAVALGPSLLGARLAPMNAVTKLDTGV
jgi:hypothetical protein